MCVTINTMYMQNANISHLKYKLLTISTHVFPYMNKL